MTWVDRYRGERAWSYDAERCHSLRWAKEQCAVEDFAVSGPLLDVPCGTGRYFEIYQHRGIEATGIDISPDMLAVARQRYPAARFIEGDIFNLPFEAQQFDTTVCTRLLDWLDPEEMERAIAALRAVARSLIVSIRHGNVWRRVNWTHSLSRFYAAVSGLYIEGRRTTEVSGDGTEEIIYLRPPVWADAIEQFRHHGHTPAFEMHRLAQPWAEFLGRQYPDFMSGRMRIKADYWSGRIFGEIIAWMEAIQTGYRTDLEPRYPGGPVTIVMLGDWPVILDGRRRGNQYMLTPDELFPVLVLS